MTRERTIRGQVAVVGVGETTYYKHGQAPEPEFALALQAILRGLRGRRDRPPADRRLRLLQQRPQRSVAPGRGPRPARAALLEHAVGRRRRRRLGGGGQRGGRGGARATPTASWSSGRSPRASSSASARRRPAAPSRGEAALTFPYGLISPAQRFAMRVMRFMHDHGVQPGGAAGDRAGLVSPRAGQPARRHARAAAHRGGLRRLALDRRALPPLRLLHGERRRRRAGAGVGRARARPARSRPRTSSAWRRAPSIATRPAATTRPIYATSSFTTVAPHLYEMAGLGPKDVDVVQSYENFTGGVLMSLVEHGFFARRGGQRLPDPREPDRAGRPAAAQHQRRQPRRVLHARARAADRGGAPAARRVDQPGARRATWRW